MLATTQAIAAEAPADTLGSDTNTAKPFGSKDTTYDNGKDTETVNGTSHSSGNNNNYYNTIASGNPENGSSSGMMFNVGGTSQVDFNKPQYFDYSTYSTVLNSLHYTSYDATNTDNTTFKHPSIPFSVPQTYHSSLPVNLAWYPNHFNNSDNVSLNHSFNQDFTMEFEKNDHISRVNDCQLTTTAALQTGDLIPSSSIVPTSAASTITTFKSSPLHSISHNNSDLENFSKGTLVTNPNPPEYFFNSPQFDLYKEVPTLVKLAHRNKDIKLSDTQDETKRAEFQQNLFKKIKRKRQASYATKLVSGKFQESKNNSLFPQTANLNCKSKRTIGRPLTPKTKVRLTLVPNLPTLYSMLVTENIDFSKLKSHLSTSPSPSSSSSSSSLSLPFSNSLKIPAFNKNIREKFKVLKRGNLDDKKAYEELLFNESVDWRFKTSSVSDSNHLDAKHSGTSENGMRCGGGFPSKTQVVTFLDTNEDDEEDDSKARYPVFSMHEPFPNAIGIGEDSSLVYKLVDTAVREIFGLEEYTFLRITRAAAFEKTGSVVLKMETIKPGYKWLDDDEFDLKIMFRIFGGENLDELDHDSDESSNQFGRAGDPVTTTFLKKKIARPRYKSNMRIYLIPRNTDVILYTRESMLKRDIINGTLDLCDDTDPRMIITAFEFENVLRELKMI
ncbi:hypothetical protein PMKS-001208 [Pichia membranifaciens]|uniref:Uncharacterized protein n=1 Tax=Pichia membranifaciens TaxID=4926 RepID=A0A1Q2YDX0_9ASCO|nr:hypothetical protein PMKS-001208 [Pichia membranifaciens]